MATQNPPPNGPPRPPVDLSIASIAGNIDEGFPATDLIKVLLRYIAVDAAKFGRDVQTSAQVFSRSHVAYNAIQELMKNVEQSTTIDFPSFDKYTTAIPPLERILLEYYANYPDDKARSPLPPTDGVETAILFIDIWESDREMLLKALADLSVETLKSLSADAAKRLEEDYRPARHTDDIQTLRALNAFFNGNRLSDRDIVNPRGKKLLTNVKTNIRLMMNSVTKAPPAEKTMVIAVKTALISYIPFAMLVATGPSADWKEYLRSTQIWEAMDGLVAHVEFFVRSSQPQGQVPTLTELEEEWDKFKRLLLKRADEIIDLTDEMVLLLKLAANIRRPLHGRSVQLIRMLFFLDDHSRDKKNNATRHRNDLKLTMNDSIDILGQAKEAIKDVKKITLSDTEYQKQNEELKTTFTKIGDLFKQIGLSDQWPEREKSYNDAVKVDEEHLTLMRKRLGLVAAT